MTVFLTRSHEIAGSTPDERAGLKKSDQQSRIGQGGWKYNYYFDIYATLRHPFNCFAFCHPKMLSTWS